MEQLLQIRSRKDLHRHERTSKPTDTNRILKDETHVRSSQFSGLEGPSSSLGRELLF